MLPNREVAPSPPPAHPLASPPAVESVDDVHPVGITAPGDKAKARDLLTAIWMLKALEEARRPASPDERRVLVAFPGFGVVALGLFPAPVTGRSTDTGGQQLGGVSP